MASLLALNAQRWAKAKMTREADYKTPVSRILAAKDRYKQISVRTAVPWDFIAGIHLRESNLDFSTYLGNGQRLDHVTTIVPKGRGPFQSFEDGATDALFHAPPYIGNNKDWSIPSYLTASEALNGLGYYYHGLPSPYVWSGTDQYVKGKFVADHVFDPNVVDKQLGTAGLIICLQKADKTVTFPNPVEHAPEVPANLPSPKDAGAPPPPKAEDGWNKIWEWLQEAEHYVLKAIHG